jgi:hypothetical protein
MVLFNVNMVFTKQRNFFPVFDINIPVAARRESCIWFPRYSLKCTGRIF